MVLYRDKVYNIQIRYQEENQKYLLGTGLKGKEVFCVFHTISLHLKVSPLSSLPGSCFTPVEFCLFQIEYVTAGNKIRLSCLHSRNEGVAKEDSY